MSSPLGGKYGMGRGKRLRLRLLVKRTDRCLTEALRRAGSIARVASLAAVGSLASAGSFTHAQDTGGFEELMRRASDNGVNVQTAFPEVEANLDRFLQSTQRAQGYMQNKAEGSPESETSAANPAMMPQPTAANPTEFEPVESTPPENSPSIKEIRDRINLLKRFQQNKQFESTNQGDSRLGGLPGLPSTGNVSPNSTAPAVAPVDPRILSALENKTAEAKPEPPAPAETVEKVVEAKQVFPSPVNAMALGESLFLTENYSAALRAFQEVDDASMDQSDRTWLEFLIAICRRRLGDEETAEAQLRELSNTQSDDYPVKASRFWLKQTEMMRENRPVVEALSGEIDVLIERARSYAEF